MNSFEVQKMRRQKLTPIQKDLIVGSLLGDGYLMPTSCGFSFRVHHSVKQKEYLVWKYNLLKNIVNTGPKRDSPKSYYFRTVSHPEFNKYREIFYDKENRKIVPDELSKILNSRSLAVWIMDDGSRDGGALRIHSYSFNYAENVFLKDVLEDRFGIETNIHKDKGMFRLWIKAASMDRLKKLVMPHILPSMLYKFKLSP